MDERLKLNYCTRPTHAAAKTFGAEAGYNALAAAPTLFDLMILHTILYVYLHHTICAPFYFMFMFVSFHFTRTCVRSFTSCARQMKCKSILQNKPTIPHAKQ